MIMAVSDVISSIPISTYGLGVRDLTYIGLFPLFIDVAVEKIVSLSIFWFVIIWLTPSIIGIFVTVYETRKINKIKIDEITSRRFENYMKKFPELYNSLASIVKNYVSNKIKKPIIIDLGCGPGLLSKEINKVIPNGKIIGMDQSVDMLKIARENAKIETIQVISEKIPLDNDSADVLVSRFSLTYWKNPKESFSEIYRVLKPNGIVVMELLNREYPRWKIFYRKIAMIFKGAGWVARYHADAYKTAYTFDNAKKLIINSGFKINNIIGNKRNWSFIIVANK
jgi:ubiquinone/menaquinone biosynthesis C-methylase UbiE